MWMPEENCWLNHSPCRGRTFQPPGLLLVKNLKIGQKRYLTVIAGSVGQKPQIWREKNISDCDGCRKEPACQRVLPTTEHPIVRHNRGDHGVHVDAWDGGFGVLLNLIR